MTEKFAFETDKVSIAYPLIAGLGDTVIMKKIFDALVELEPNCAFDLYAYSDNHMKFGTAFFGDSKNLNRVLNYHEHYDANVKNYDLAILVFGGRAILLQHVNVERLQEKSPALFEAVVKIDAYNKQNYFEIGSPNAVSLRNAIMSRILGKNCFYILSADGALPIRDDKVDIPLKPEYKPEFDALKLGNYITVYTDIYADNKDNPKVKCWPLRYWHEYVELLKRHFPQFEIIQCGGGYDIAVENVDRNFLGCDLELTKYILANSLLLVGGEGGLVHLATALGTKCIVLFGPSYCAWVGYARNINLVSDLCFPCFDIWGDAQIRFCPRTKGEPLCMLSHTPQKVFEVTRNHFNRVNLKNNA